MEKEIKDQGTEEIFDDELKKIFNDQHREAPVTVEEEELDAGYEQTQVTGCAAFWNRIKTPLMIALADGLMFYMCLSGKIDQIYGMAFIAFISAAFGQSLRQSGVYEA